MQPQTTALQRNDPERGVEFIPYGAADKIKLNVKIIQNMVAVPTKSGKTCSERDALRFLMLCQAQRLNPFAGDAFLVGYDGANGPTFSLITAHQAFLKRAETCEDFEGMESGIILQGEDGSISEREGDFYLEGDKDHAGEYVVGGWARVHRKGRRDTYRRIRLSRFNNGFAQWKVDAAGMIVKCAEADALRSTFPTLLGGLYIQGEQAADRIVADIVTTKPIFDSTPKVVALPAQAAQSELPEPGEEDFSPARPDPALSAATVAETSTVSQTSSAAVANGSAASAGGKAKGSINYLRSIASLLKMSGHKEVELLDYLRASGKVDDSLSSLEEISMVAEPAIVWLYENWAGVDSEIKKLKAGGAK